MKKRTLLFASLLALGSHSFAQSSDVIRKYIDTYKDIAMAEEIRTGVPAAITLAQGIHETSAGTSDLVVSSNNHFGIKCKTGWTGATVYHDDDARGECFRKYDDPSESYKDHSDFLKNRPNYTALFQLDPTDYRGWAFGLKKAGYATNPRYPQILIKLIEDYDLESFTLLALKGTPVDGNGAQWASTTTANTTTVSNGEDTKTDVQPLVERTVTYPSGVFRINETNVIFVPKGTAYLKIAEENNIAIARLYEFNDMSPVDIAAKDGLVYLQRKRKTGAHDQHTVAPGETIEEIAQTEGLRIENLREYNWLQSGQQAAPGEALYLQAKAPAQPRLASTVSMNAVAWNNRTPVVAPAADAFIMHEVQPKETAYAIAKKYGVTIEDVLKWNDLQTTELHAGQQLRIYKKNTDAN